MREGLGELGRDDGSMVGTGEECELGRDGMAEQNRRDSKTVSAW